MRSLVRTQYVPHIEFRVYILYSAQLDRYYIGSTSVEITERLRRHNSIHKGFTGSSPDWVIVYWEVYKTKTEALIREKHIKKWKSRVMIENLINKDKPVQSIPTLRREGH